MRTKEDVINRIGKQICSPVLWEKCVCEAVERGMNQFIEIGPKPVLGGLVGTVNKQIEVMQIVHLEFNHSEMCDIQFVYL